jgi:ribosomal protein S12 methylthiotransferase accessory factor
LGLFTGRILAEEASYPQAESGFALLDAIYPRNHFTPFFRGLLDLRHQHLDNAIKHFSRAEALQPTPEEQALVAFYQAYALTRKQDWATACRHLDRAIHLSPGSHAYHNLRGTARFKLKEYPQAAQDFQQAIDIDNGSAIDRANLGICYKHLGQKLKAIELLHTGLELDPGLDFARQALDELLH